MTEPVHPEQRVKVVNALKEVVDPDLGINVIDLGFVYSITWGANDDTLVIHMTLRSVACPLVDMFEDQIAKALIGIVDQARINWVWMPPWSLAKVTDDGRSMLRALGVAT